MHDFVRVRTDSARDVAFSHVIEDSVGVAYVGAYRAYADRELLVDHAFVCCPLLVTPTDRRDAARLCPLAP